MIKSIIKVCSILLILSSVSIVYAGPTTKYDLIIKKKCEQYFPGMDYNWCKAQWYQESLLDPNARSHVGAMGLTQCMPGTFKDISKALRFPKHVTAYMPEYSIWAGTYYLWRMHRIWSSKRPWKDRLQLSQASYNAGAGHLLKAQRLSGGKTLYKEIIVYLPNVTGHHSKETITYVIRIERWYERFKIGAM
jgi:membrane-bound lytic murein transglycosylase F